LVSTVVKEVPDERTPRKAMLHFISPGAEERLRKMGIMRR